MRRGCRTTPPLPPPCSIRSALPRGAIAPAHRSRFSVYRNNVLVKSDRSARGALSGGPQGTRQGILRRAGASLRRPPSAVFADHRLLRREFRRFLDAFRADVPYLGDLARLEASRTRAYHSADIAPLGAAALARLKPEALATLRLALHPAVAIITSPHPIVTIWAMNIGDMPLAPITDWRGEDALVARPKLDVEVRRLPPGGGVFLTRLAQSECFTAAAMAALEASPDFDLAVNLACLFGDGLVVGLLS